MPPLRRKKPDPLGLRDPSNPRNWELVCRFCGPAWPAQATMGETLVPHMRERHPGRRYEFNIKWVGKGRAPKRPLLPKLEAESKELAR